MKRIDGRIKYTKQAIRNNLLKLIRIMPIEKITVNRKEDGATEIVYVI